MVLDTFAKRLRAYRKLKSLTQEEFASAIGVSIAVAGGWERGTRSPKEEEIKRIGFLLCVSREELGLPAMQNHREGGDI